MTANMGQSSPVAQTLGSASAASGRTPLHGSMGMQLGLRAHVPNAIYIGYE
jgi:hypothetical protein